MLRDTAGLHVSRDPVETLGMAKTLENSGSADLVLFVLEAHRPLGEEDVRVYEWIRSKPLLIVLNKIDLLNGSAAKAEVPDDWLPERCVRISALSGQGGGGTAGADHPGGHGRKRPRGGRHSDPQPAPERVAGAQSGISGCGR